MAHFDVLVLGAGIAGLAGARVLSESGLSLALLEARDRIGGRIFTSRPAGGTLPVELGAEFVHGQPREIFELAQAARLTLYELTGDVWTSESGRLSKARSADRGMNTILQAISDWQGEDRSLEAFLAERFAGDRWAAARNQVRGYIEGFDAAAPDQVSVRWLKQTEAASASIGGERQFRILEGYDRLLWWLRDGLNAERTLLASGTVVRDIQWERGQVEVTARAADGGTLSSFTAQAALITLPQGVLAAPTDAAGAVRFIPALPKKQIALKHLAMGPVVKVVFRFREAFWDTGSRGRQRMSRLSFLFSDNEVMPTWWTSYPLLTPVLTGWTGGPRAANLVSVPDATLAERALQALARVLGMQGGYLEAQLDAWQVHNWSADPYSRGAYSYVCVGGLKAPQVLSEPVEDTLFFAGEATNDEGHTGTVHGALATGRRGAEAIIAKLRSRT
jgi:monoamine oxidase